MNELITVITLGTATIAIVWAVGYILFRRWRASEIRKAERFREQNR